MRHRIILGAVLSGLVTAIVVAVATAGAATSPDYLVSPTSIAGALTMAGPLVLGTDAAAKHSGTLRARSGPRAAGTFAATARRHRSRPCTRAPGCVAKLELWIKGEGTGNAAASGEALNGQAIESGEFFANYDAKVYVWCPSRSTCGSPGWKGIGLTGPIASPQTGGVNAPATAQESINYFGQVMTDHGLAPFSCTDPPTGARTVWFLQPVGSAIKLRAAPAVTNDISCQDPCQPERQCVGGPPDILEVPFEHQYHQLPYRKLLDGKELLFTWTDSSLETLSDGCCGFGIADSVTGSTQTLWKLTAQVKYLPGRYPPLPRRHR